MGLWVLHTFMIYIMVFFSYLIMSINSPSILLILIILFSIFSSMYFLFFKMFFLFFIWGLVYVGGMMIIFTYVVFFSNYGNLLFSFPTPLFFFLFFFLKKIFLLKSFTGPKTVNLGESMEIEKVFFFLSESGSVFFFYLFICIGMVLLLILPMLKTQLNKYTQSVMM